MKQFSNRLLSISLAFILFCMSLFGSFAVPTIKVKGAEVLALYSVEEIMATILFSLGVTIQGYDSLTDGSSALDLSSDRYQVIQGGGGSQEDPDQDPDPSSYVILPSKQDALSFEEQLKLSQEYEQYKFDEMIANAQKTGKIVIDKSSGAWEFLKSKAGEVVNAVKNLPYREVDENYEELYKMNAITDTTSFYKYLYHCASSMYSSLGVSVNGDYTKMINSAYADTSSNGCYYLLFSTKYNDGINIYNYLMATKVSSVQDLRNRIDYIKANFKTETSRPYCAFNVWPISSSNGYMTTASYNVRWNGLLQDFRVLDPLTFNNYTDLVKNGYSSYLSHKSGYEQVYSPTPDHATDIITPGNTVIPNPDGSYAIGGDYVIDVTNPITYPVDLTDGVSLDDSKKPISEIVPEGDPSEDVQPDPEPDPSLSFWERLFEWLKRIYDMLTQLPQILTDHGLTLGNIVTSLSSINLTVGAIQQIADSLLTAFNGLEIPDYSDLIQEVPSKIAEALEFPEINFPEIEIPDYTSIFEQMLEFLSYLPKLGNIESLLTSIFVVDFNAVNDALYKALDVWDFDFLKDLQNLIGLLKYADDYRYPKFKIKCPAILAPYYDNDEIVLCDFANYKVQLLWCRNAIRMMLWVYFLYCVFRHFKVRFTVS